MSSAPPKHTAIAPLPRPKFQSTWLSAATQTAVAWARPRRPLGGPPPKKKPSEGGGLEACLELRRAQTLSPLRPTPPKLLKNAASPPMPAPVPRRSCPHLEIELRDRLVEHIVEKCRERGRNGAGVNGTVHELQRVVVAAHGLIVAVDQVYYVLDDGVAARGKRRGRGRV
eukprot:355626-Chlamydomonas_euryale.AAC.3